MKKISYIFLCFVIILLLGIGVKCVISNSSVKLSVDDFEDSEMGELILWCTQFIEEEKLGVDEDVTEEYVEKIRELNIAYTGYYETINDIKRCRNLEKLIIGAPNSGYVHYRGKHSEISQPESAEKIAQIEDELGEILVTCVNLKELWICNPEETCNLQSLDFLGNMNSLEWLSLHDMGVIDYSPIYDCTSLTVLDLKGCEIAELQGISELSNLTHLFVDGTNVSEAGDIPNMKQLEVLMIEDTPLAENEEELALIYEAFPDIEIYK